MFEFLIVTNNRTLQAHDGQVFSPAPVAARGNCAGPAVAGGFRIKSVTGGVEDVYDAISELLQNGHALVSSPLPANVPLIRSPVRSVILEKQTRRFDAKGLLVLEKARDRIAVLGINDDERVRADLETIDRDQLLRAMAQLEELAACPNIDGRQM